MYGKPEWFLASRGRWLVRPNTWQGWVYACAWVAAMLLPSLALLAREQLPEAFVWLILSNGLWLWDSAMIRRAKQALAPKEVYYIGDDAGEVV